MKGRNSSVPLFIFTPAFIGVLLGLTLAGTSALQAAGGMVATVTAVEGQAEVVAKDSKTPVPVRLEMRVLPGSTVRTKANGRVELQFTDRSLLRLDQNTEITILESEQECGVLVTLGKLWAKVQTVVGASKFQIKTPTIVAGVRGTILRTEVTEEESVIAVDEGEVEVSSSTDGSPMILSSLQEARAHRGT